MASHQEELARRAGEAIALLPVLRDGLLATRHGIFAAENADGRVTLLLSDDPALATLSDGPVSGAINGASTAAVSGTQPAPTRVASRRARNARRASGRLPRDIDSSPEPICRLLATLRWFEALDVSATAIVGHGLGEIAGLAWAGVLSEADVVEIAALRAEFLSGPAVRVLPASGRHAGRHRDAEPVPASDPLSLLRDAVGQFRFGPPRRRLISTRTGRELASASEVIDLICDGFAAKDHLTEAVAAGAVGATLLIETGPGQLLAATAARACRVPTISMDLGEASAGRAGRTWAGAALFAAGAIGQVLPLFAGQPSRPIDMWRDRVFITSGAAVPVTQADPRTARDSSADAVSAPVAVPAPADGPDHAGMSEGARTLDVAAPVGGGGQAEGREQADASNLVGGGRRDASPAGVARRVLARRPLARRVPVRRVPVRWVARSLPHGLVRMPGRPARETSPRPRPFRSYRPPAGRSAGEPRVGRSRPADRRHPPRRRLPPSRRRRASQCCATG